MAKPAFRVYVIQHHDGRCTGILMRRWDAFFDVPPPQAYGRSEEEVLTALETQLRQRELEKSESLSRYLWTEEFHVRRVDIEVHPQAVVRRRPVVGKNTISLRLHYAWTELESGGYHILLPRYGWWIVLEELAIAPEVLRNAVSGYLLGEETRSLYEFREHVSESVQVWSSSLAHRFDDLDPFDDYEDVPTLESLAEELVQRAVKRRLPQAVSRGELDPEERAFVVRRPPASILLVGETGVGKSTWVRGLAEFLARQKRSKHVEPPPRIWRIPGDQFIAGMQYLGQWQQRVLDVVSELRHENDYLYVDRLTSILKAQGDGTSVADLLLPALQADEISLIAEASESELGRARERSPALVSQFRLVRLSEASRDQVAALIPPYLSRKAPWMSMTPLALARMLRVLAHYQRHVAFPGKAFRFVDWLIEQKKRGETSPKATVLSPENVMDAFSRYSGIPVTILSEDVQLGSATIAETLSKSVVGQDEACRVASRTIARFKAGLDDPEKPVGSLFFVGPTGVGKTELTKVLARFLFGSDERLIRIDMSEYGFPGSARRLLQTGGTHSLAERVRQRPLSVVLLDEIEKADLEVFDLLLGILGEGRLSDALGQLVDFRMTLIVMTSNLGTTDADVPGFTGDARTNFTAAVKKHFRPEFVNRIDAIVPFRSLAPEHVRKIVDLELVRAMKRTGVTKRGLTLEISSDVREWLATEGFHPKRGARPLKRVIEERVVTPLAVRLAAEPGLRDRRIAVRVSNGHIDLVV